MNIIKLSEIMARAVKHSLISQMEMSLCKWVQTKWRGKGAIVVINKTIGGVLRSSLCSNFAL